MVRFSVILIYICVFFCYDTVFCQINSQETVHNLYTCANEAFNEGYYKKSVNLFTKLNEQYPFSTYESIALLKLADAHFELGQYLDSIIMYERFEEKYSHDEYLPHVLYKKAKAYLNQTRGLVNDQTCTKIALDNYLKLIELFPGNKYSYMANTDISTCYKNLSGYEFSVGIFYYKNKKYNSAISRFSKLISSYPDNGYHYLALLYMAECESLIQKAKNN